MVFFDYIYCLAYKKMSQKVLGPYNCLLYIIGLVIQRKDRDICNFNLIQSIKVVPQVYESNKFKTIKNGGYTLDMYQG